MTSLSIRAQHQIRLRLSRGGWSRRQAQCAALRSCCTSTAPPGRFHAAYSHPVMREWQERGAGSLRASDLVYPIFVTDDHLDCQEIAAMPGQHRWGWVRCREMLEDLVAKGLKSVILFGVHTKKGGLKDQKDAIGSSATSDESPVTQAIGMIRQHFPDLQVITDVCLCAYTDHGHCGLLGDDGLIDNEPSIKRLSEIALHYAKAGAHIVAPSDMMDGRIGAIKGKLHENGFGGKVAVMSYGAKFDSVMYGPFRNACASAPASRSELTGRSTYQLPVSARSLAKRVIDRDVREGADFVMVKPAVPYLDVVRDTADRSPVPVAVYQASAEYAMLYHAAQAGTFELEDAVMEQMNCLKRGGANIVISYFTPQILNWLNKR